MLTLQHGMTTRFFTFIDEAISLVFVFYIGLRHLPVKTKVVRLLLAVMQSARTLLPTER